MTILNSIFGPNDVSIATRSDQFPPPRWSPLACNSYVSTPMRPEEYWMVAWHVQDHAVGLVFETERKAVEAYEAKFGGG